MSKRVSTSEETKYWKVFLRPTYEKAMHTKLLLKRRKDEQ